MPDESAADDGVIHAEWAAFTPEAVGDYFDRLEILYRAFIRLRGADPPPALVSAAHDLSDHALALGHLPALRAVLAQGLAP